MDDSHKLIDALYFHQTKEIMGDADFAVIVQYFFDDIAATVAAMEAALEQQNYTDLRRLSHTIKSSARQIGAGGISDCAAEIESFAKADGQMGACDIAGFVVVAEETRALYGEYLA